MNRVLSSLVVSSAFCSVAVLSVAAQDTKKSAKSEIAGGIEGQIKSVDKTKQTLTITTSNNKEETFAITTDTVMFGPRGGKVRQRLNDSRFHEGLEITVVGDGTKAKEIHLGYASRTPGASKAKKAADGDAMPKAKGTAKANRRLAREAAAAGAGAEVEKSKADAADDDDDEVPGKIKSFNGRILVVTLANGSNRSFILPNDVKIKVNGMDSTTGLKEPAIKEGEAVTVLLEKGGRRVREIELKSAPAAAKKTTKKAA